MHQVWQAKSTKIVTEDLSSIQTKEYDDENELICEVVIPF